VQKNGAPEVFARRLVGDAWLRDHSAGIPGYNDASAHNIDPVDRGKRPVMRWLSGAAEEGDAEAQWLSAKILMYEKNCGFGTYKWPQPATIERYLLAAAEAGLEKARYSLATFYWFDDPEYKDGAAKGVAYFASPASTGDALAEAYMARAYECGRGVGKDRAEAMRYYRAVSSAPNRKDAGYSIDLQGSARAGLSRLLTWDTAGPTDRENMEDYCRWSLLDTMARY
jgi:hypothetical protein